MSKAIVSKHAEKRIRERSGINKNSVGKNATLALEKGLRHSETSGRLKKYMDGLFMAQCQSNNTRIYHHQVYLFNKGILITVFPLPHNLCGIADSQYRKLRQPQEESDVSSEKG